MNDCTGMSNQHAPLSSGLTSPGRGSILGLCLHNMAPCTSACTAGNIRIERSHVILCNAWPDQTPHELSKPQDQATIGTCSIICSRRTSRCMSAHNCSTNKHTIVGTRSMQHADVRQRCVRAWLRAEARRSEIMTTLSTCWAICRPRAATQAASVLPVASMRTFRDACASCAMVIAIETGVLASI